MQGPPGQRRVERLRGDLRHDSIDTLADFLRKQVLLSRIAAQSLRARGERGSVFRLVTSPPAAWLKQVLMKQAWRDGVELLMFAKNGAF